MKVTVTITSKVFREQFGDWLAGGRVEVDGKTYEFAVMRHECRTGWNIEYTDEEPEDEAVDKVVEEALDAANLEYTLTREI